MVGNASQTSKKEKGKKPQETQPIRELNCLTAEEGPDSSKPSSNPQTPKQDAKIDLDKAGGELGKQDSDASYPPYDSQFNTSSGKKSRYKGKGYDATGRPRNFYNPPGKVMRHLAQ